MKTRKDEITEQCAAYHKAHPEVWDMFVKFTRQAIARGYKNYSVYAIFERIRWEMEVGGDGENEFKINNNYRTLYARRFMKMYPEHDGFFRTRRQTSEDAPATNLSPLRPRDYA